MSNRMSLSDSVHLDSPCSNMVRLALVTRSDVHVQMASNAVRFGKQSPNLPNLYSVLLELT